MPKTANFLATWSLLGVMAALLGTSTTAYGQTLFCQGWRAIESDPGKPFTAQNVSHSVTHYPDGTEHTFDSSDLVARDTGGRVYREWHPPSIDGRRNQPPDVSSRKEGRIYTAVISISDCGGGKATTVFPDMKIARVTEGPRTDLHYNSFFEALAYMQRPSNTVFEDLGFKEIEGFPTHGFRVMVLGTEDDGEWSGKPTYFTECWVSDDLAATILEIHTSLRGKNESRGTLTHIQRQEPNASLFEIPSDYKINPPPEEQAPSTVNAKPIIQQKN
jgi:hypothetical protein